MKLSNLEYFQVVCKHKNMTRAAEELHISQPGLSHVIRELEEEFGLTLFLRQNKGIVLTEEGQQFLNEVNMLLEHADMFERRMKRLGEVNTTVKIGIPPASGTLIFPDVIQALREEYPQIKIQLSELGSLGNRKSVLDGNVDVALVSSRTPMSSAFGSCLLTPVEIHYYVSTKNPLAGGTSVTLGEIGEYPCVLLTEDSFLASDVRAAYERENRKPNIMFHTNQVSIIQQLVENNTAGTFLFGGVLPESDLYVELPVAGIDPACIYLIWNKSNPLTPMKEKLIRLIRSMYRKSTSQDLS